MSNYNRTATEGLNYHATFEVYQPGNPSTFEIAFEGISITNFNTSFNPIWSPEKAAGRADPLYRYEQFTREVTLAFDLIAYSPKDHDNNYRDLNRLAASTMPVYDTSANSGNGYNGCLVKVQIGSISEPLLRGFAILNSLGYSWDDKYTWKVARSTAVTDDPPYLVSQYLKDDNQGAPVGTSVTLSLIMVGKDNDTRYGLEGTQKSNNLFNLKKFF